VFYRSDIWIENKVGENGFLASFFFFFCLPSPLMFSSSLWGNVGLLLAMLIEKLV